MLIKYYKDVNNWLWACIANADGTYTHYFLGSKNLDKRKANMYDLLINTVLVSVYI